MNIAVIRVKDIIKYIFYIICLSIIVLLIVKLVKSKEELKDTLKEQTSIISEIKNSSFLYCLKSELSIFSIEEDNEKMNEIDNLSNILTQELAILDSYDENYEEEIVESEEDIEVVEVAKEDEEESDDEEEIETEVIEENNITASYTNDENNVKVNNQTSFDITETISSANYEITNNDKVIIYHTHTCESYTSSENYSYEMTGNYRTTDLNYTVSRVGEELESYLIKKYQKTVIHDNTYHDYPSYNGSYSRSLTTLTSLLEDNSDAEVIIDLHRDAVGSSESYAPTVKIGDELCAQLMFVIGTNGSRIISS